MDKTGKLVIVGNSAFAEIAYEYFTYDSPYEVVGFAVEPEYLNQDRFCGLPLVSFTELERHFAPAAHSVFAACTYTQLNRLRTRFARQAREKGYALASYVSSKAFVWRNVTVGEHCFIFENNVVQPFCKIGNNVVLWSGNHIGHHSTIRDNVFISSHVVISGFCDVGENSFLGVNATISNNVVIAKDTLVGAGVTVLKNTQEGLLYGTRNAEAHKALTAKQYFKVQES